VNNSKFHRKKWLPTSGKRVFGRGEQAYSRKKFYPHRNPFPDFFRLFREGKIGLGEFDEDKKF
jgi:hypothetical protein